ncbi:hypothetical protein ACJ2A9_04730 [Anaerobacillus sp. MEB173]|uniref:hypothetical protein n=1 Tax=Anaerobacillus sp. MEB173 TaxID=3383345 RepID=UPI003F92F1A4
MRKNLVHIGTLICTLCIGIVVGISMDKQWLTDQQLSYVSAIQSENKQLQEQQEQWLTFVEDELKQMNIFIPSKNEQYQGIAQLLTHIGIEAERMYSLDAVLQNKGIIITLGEEMDFPTDIPHLSLEMIPEQEKDINQFYVSLLRLKENINKNDE